MLRLWLQLSVCVEIVATAVCVCRESKKKREGRQEKENEL